MNRRRLAKDRIWVNCSAASPVASTNQFLIEDVSHLMKGK